MAITNVTLNSLAFFFTADRRFQEKALRIVNEWFVDTNTSILPRTDYAGRDSYATIQLRDIFLLVDAVSIVSPPHSPHPMKLWCDAYDTYLSASEESGRNNNHVLYYHIQKYAIATSCSGRTMSLSAVVSKVSHMVKKNGRMPLEDTRSRSAHYVLFTLYGMATLERVLRNQLSCQRADWLNRKIQKAIRYYRRSGVLSSSGLDPMIDHQLACLCHIAVMPEPCPPCTPYSFELDMHSGVIPFSRILFSMPQNRG